MSRLCQRSEDETPLKKNWYIEEDMNQHMKVIHEAQEDAITFSWHGFYETVPSVINDTEVMICSFKRELLMSIYLL